MDKNEFKFEIGEPCQKMIYSTGEYIKGIIVERYSGLIKGMYPKFYRELYAVRWNKREIKKPYHSWELEKCKDLNVAIQ